MKAEELIDLGATIDHAFDPSACGWNNSRDVVLKAFRKEIKLLQNTIVEKSFEFARKTNKKSDLKYAHVVEDAFMDLVERSLPWAFFGLGYAVGQMLDLTDPDALKAVKTIQKEIREKGLLPYLPRERKAT